MTTAHDPDAHEAVPTPADMPPTVHHPVPAPALTGDLESSPQDTPSHAPAGDGPAGDGPAGDGPGDGSASEQVADRVAAAVRSVPGVADLYTDPLGGVATFLPGRRVAGVAVRDDVTEVQVVLTWGVPVRQTAQQIQRSLASIVDTPVHVVVQDVMEPAVSTVSRPASETPDTP